jgi:hypothetical protein
MRYTFLGCLSSLIILVLFVVPGESFAGEFLTYTSYPEGTPHRFASGDFVGNGRSDLAVLNAGGNNVTVFLTNSDGTLKKPVKYPIGIKPVSIAVGDVNGDGKLDIIVANNGNPKISQFGTLGVLLGNGDGTFRKAIQTQVGTVFPTWLGVGDFNGDGHLDVLALVTGQATMLTVFLGNGDGTFRTGASYGVGPYFVSVLLADFNNDGKPDVAELYLCGGGPCNVTVLPGNGDGTFQSGIVTPLPKRPQTQPAGMVVGDFNNDGNQDLVVELSGETAGYWDFLSGKGDGTFSVSNVSLSGNLIDTFPAQDVNGDGKLDLLIGNGAVGVFILLGNGDGTFQNQVAVYDVGQHTHFAGLADLNGDGKLDVVALNDYDIGVALGNGNGTLQAAMLNFGCCASARPLVSADFNGDGKADIVSSASDGLGVSLGNGDGTFTFSGFCSVGAGSGLRVADLNHDKHPDLLASGSGYIFVCLGNGDGTFQPEMKFFAGGSDEFDLADFNGDGNLDLAVPTGGLVNILLGNGDGTFQSAVNQGLGTQAVYVVAGDFNGDGKADLIVLGGNGKTYVMLGRGDGTFKNPVVIAGAAGSSVRTGDFNRDGKLDLAISNHGSITLLLGKGNGTFQLGKTYGSGFLASWTTRDFNGDGKLDLLAITPTGFAVLLGNGDGTFQPQVNYPMTGTTPAAYLTAADFNGDHKLDLAIAGRYGTDILFNTGHPAK